MASDPRSIVRSEEMSSYQTLIVTICVLIAALDGFDVLAIAYTAPSIAREWGLSPTSLGVVFSGGPVGMALGAALVAPIADRFGRRPVVLLSLLILAAGMQASAFTNNTAALAIMRAFTGIGIGSALAGINVVVAEYAPDRRRSLAISLMTIGYPAGATLGGFFSIYLIGGYGWRSVYVFGALVAALLFVLALLWLPESIDFLVSRRPKNALMTINRIMAKMGRAPRDEFPEYLHHDEEPGASPLAIFRQQYLTSTIASSIAYFGVLFTVYFMLTWTPQLLTELGFSISGGISGSLLMNIAGVVGGLLFGFAANAIGPRLLAGIFMAGLFLSTALFGVTPGSSAALFIVTVLTGFFLFTSATALYVIVPAAFPAAIRSTGVGFSIGMGRVGAIAAPFVAGLLIENGWSRATYCLALAAPALIAAVSVYWIAVIKAAESPAGDAMRPNRPMEVDAVRSA